MHTEASGSGEPRPLGHGSHPEVMLRAQTMRWSGRADLLTCAPGATEIVDYKTGAPDDSHVEQLRIYALLWFRDRQVNPAARIASRLVVAYPVEDVVVEAPSEEELSSLEAELVTRTEAVRAHLGRRPPEARPAEALCATCPVRQLCGEYWALLGQVELLAAAKSTAEPLWGDLEMVVDARNGPRSWWASVASGASRGQSNRVMLRTATESPPFGPDTSIRVVNGAIIRDEEVDVPIVTLTAYSEVFVLSGRPRRPA